MDLKALEGKIKFITIGLAVILVVSIFVNLKTYSAKRFIERERDELKTDNKTLTKKINEAAKEIKEFQEKVDGLNSDLDKITRENDNLLKQKERIQRDYELIIKERGELEEKAEVSIHTGAAGETSPSSSREDIYWASVLKSKTDLSLQVDNLRAELKKLNTENQQLRKDLENLTRDKDEVQQQLEYNQKTFDNITSQLVLEKNTKFKIQDQLKPIRSENISLRRQVKRLISQKTSLESQFRMLQEEKSELERRLSEIELFLQDRLTRTKETDIRSKVDILRSGGVDTGGAGIQRKESIELPPIVVRPQGEISGSGRQPIADPLVEERGGQVHTGGSVLGVNKENNFAVINLGQDAGIKMGDIFQVYKGSKAIATIEVIQVRDSLSACDIKEKIADIEVGDTVR